MNVPSDSGWVLVWTRGKTGWSSSLATASQGHSCSTLPEAWDVTRKRATYVPWLILASSCTSKLTPPPSPLQAVKRNDLVEPSDALPLEMDGSAFVETQTVEKNLLLEFEEPLGPDDSPTYRLDSPDSMES